MYHVIIVHTKSFYVSITFQEINDKIMARISNVTSGIVNKTSSMVIYREIEGR